MTGMEVTPAAVPVEDHQAISQLLSRHGHLFDDGQLESLDTLSTPDAEYDTFPMGGPVMTGIAEILRVTRELETANPVAHLVTNIVITPVDADNASVRSKGIGITTEGEIGCVTYHDQVVPTQHGWRLRRRTIRPRCHPLTFD